MDLLINKLKKYHKDYEQFSNAFSNMIDIHVTLHVSCNSYTYIYFDTTKIRLSSYGYLDILSGFYDYEAFCFILNGKFTHHYIPEL